MSTPLRQASSFTATRPNVSKQNRGNTTDRRDYNGELDMRDVLWGHLRNAKLHEIPFHQNHPLGNITADFFCPKFHIIVMVNEPGLDSKHWFYASTDAQLRHMGFRVVRFTSDDVKNDMNFVKTSIVEVVSRIAAKQNRY
jgi:very-short-patch-repair endonuclease